jgi:hypothetical protein
MKYLLTMGMLVVALAVLTAPASGVGAWLWVPVHH